MALASYVLMFAGNPLTFVGYASAQNLLPLLCDILPAYVRHLRSHLKQRVVELSSCAAFRCLLVKKAKGAVGVVSNESGMLPVW